MFHDNGQRWHVNMKLRLIRSGPKCLSSQSFCARLNLVLPAVNDGGNGIGVSQLSDSDIEGVRESCGLEEEGVGGEKRIQTAVALKEKHLVDEVGHWTVGRTYCT